MVSSFKNEILVIQNINSLNGRRKGDVVPVKTVTGNSLEKLLRKRVLEMNKWKIIPIACKKNTRKANVQLRVIKKLKTELKKIF